MTVDPGTPEGRRRTRRGLLVYVAALVALAVQGIFLVAAIRAPHDAGLWLLWAIVILLIAAGFVVESRFERKRRRKHSADL
ncbi:positive regulator of sigma E activity [Leifsonia sp. EB41]|uniref:hypothetical protein n=1 Tax=Leifsonia sp. EB41 TaxID=3156260 RepID=UPI0035144A2C